MGQLFVTPKKDLNTALEPFCDSYYYIQQLCFLVLTFNLFAYVHAMLKFYYFKSYGYHPVFHCVLFSCYLFPVECYYELLLSHLCRCLD